MSVVFCRLNCWRASYFDVRAGRPFPFNAWPFIKEFNFSTLTLTLVDCDGTRLIIKGLWAFLQVIILQQLQSVTPCKGIQDSFRFRIPTVSEIPDSLSCILDSKVRDSGFHYSNLPAADSTANISQIPESGGLPYMWPSQSFILNIKRSHNDKLGSKLTAMWYPNRIWWHCCFLSGISHMGSWPWTL